MNATMRVVLAGLLLAGLNQTARTETCVRLPGGASGWWRGDGSVIDAVSGNSGSLQGGATFAQGRVGQAFQLDGIDDFVSVPGAALDLPSITVEAWVNLAATQADRIIMAKYVQPTCCTTRGWGLGISSSANVIKWFTSAENGANDSLLGTTTLANDTWYHVAATFDGTTKRLYVNGVLDASSTWALPIGYTGTVGSIGNLQTVGLQFFNGRIDEMGVFDRALTEPEIRSIYEAGSAGKCECVQLPAGALAWWPGDGNETDVVGGHNGALHNGATFAPGRVGQSFRFDGVDDFVSLPDAGLDVPSITVEAWVNLATSQASRIITAKYVQPDCCSTRGWGFGISDESPNVVKWFTSTDDGDNDTIVSTTTLANNTWYHVAATFDGTTKRLYVNGTLEASRTWANSIGYTGTVSSIGNLQDVQAQFFDGQIDELEIFNRALTACEIKALYSAGTAGKCQGDTDADGIPDFQDNCPFISNLSQQNTDADGAGDACDCASADPGVSALPGEIGLLTGGIDGDESRLSWCSAASEAGSATVYDVVRHVRTNVAGGIGTSETCLPPGSFLNTTASDLATPSAQEPFWYLVRGRNACGAGTYGYGTDGAERHTTACP